MMDSNLPRFCENCVLVTIQRLFFLLHYFQAKLELFADKKVPELLDCFLSWNVNLAIGTAGLAQKCLGLPLVF